MVEVGLGNAEPDAEVVVGDDDDGFGVIGRLDG